MVKRQIESIERNRERADARKYKSDGELAQGMISTPSESL